MFNKTSPFEQTRPVLPALFSGTICAALSTMASITLSFTTFPPIGWYQDAPFTMTPSWLWEALVHSLNASLHQIGWIDAISHPHWFLQNFATDLQKLDLSDVLAWRMGTIIAGCATAGLIAGLHTYMRSNPRDKLVHLRGRQLITGNKAKRLFAQKEKKNRTSKSSDLALAPGVKVSDDTLSKHTLLLGSSGGGKTQILLSLLSQLIAHNDQVLLNDTKGDMTASLPTGHFILLAPHDERSWCWDIAQDCFGQLAAQELAASLIPETKDPMWSNGSREILTGVLRHLQIEQGVSWGWKDILELSFAAPEKLREKIDASYPQGARYIECDPNTGIPTKSSFGFLVGMWAAVGSTVGPLAMAWGDAPKDKSISLTQWLQTPKASQNILILQRSAAFPALSAAWMGAAMQIISNHVASPQMAEEARRKLWFMLDEFAQFGKLTGFQQVLEVGRSKGVRCVLGVQALEQISALYGQDECKTWLNNFGIKIIARMSSGPSAKSVSEDLIGQREVSWTEISTSSSFWSQNGPTTNKQTQRTTLPVVMPEALEKDLGVVRVDGMTVIRALALVHGDVFRLDWPLTIWPQQRQGTSPAKWTLE